MRYEPGHAIGLALRAGPCPFEVRACQETEFRTEVGRRARRIEADLVGRWARVRFEVDERAELTTLRVERYPGDEAPGG